jgi:hypothetical protein
MIPMFYLLVESLAAKISGGSKKAAKDSVV